MYHIHLYVCMYVCMYVSIHLSVDIKVAPLSWLFIVLVSNWNALVEVLFGVCKLEWNVLQEATKNLCLITSLIFLAWTYICMYVFGVKRIYNVMFVVGIQNLTQL